jgi:hypothetical protein
MEERVKEGEYGWCAFYTRMNIVFKPVEITIGRGQR